MRGLWMAGIVMLGLSGQAWAKAPAAEKITLQEAQALALAHYPQIVAADAAMRAAKQDVRIARSGYLPQVSGNAVRAFAGDNSRISATSGLNNPRVIDRGAAGVSVSQMITDFGHTDDMVESSKLELEAQKARSNLTRENVLLNATRAYYNLLRAQELLRVATTTLKARKVFLDQISALKEAKLKSNLDASLATQGVSQANLLLLTSRNEVEDAQAGLSEALGYGERRDFAPVEPKQVPKPPADLEELVDKAMHTNPELSALKAQAEASHKRAEAEKGANYPVVSAQGFAGATPIRDDSQNFRAQSFVGGINVSVPFYTGGRLSAQEKKAEAKASIAEQDVAMLKNQLARDIRMAFGHAQTAFANIEVTDALVKNTDEALSLIQERYRIGSSSVVDLSQAQLAQTQAQIDHANARYDYLSSLAVLAYKVGNGLSTELQQLVRE